MRFVNDYAPEHLELLSTEPFVHLGHITNAAEMLMGPHTPISIANFVLGPNGVLPTGGWARTYGPLSVTDYMKRSSVGYVTSPAYPGLARRAHNLADTRASPPTRTPSRLCAKLIWAERAERESRTPPWQARLEGR